MVLPCRPPEFWQRTTGPAAAVAVLLAPAAALVTATARLRRRLARPWPAPVPVLCVGGVTIGGSGKTPVALALTRLLQAEGQRPHVLLRGYGGRLGGPCLVEPGRHDARDVGDEALLHAARAPTWIGADRAATARAALAAGASHLVLDDGLQQTSLRPSLTFLVLDRAVALGNGRVVPAGPLREPWPMALARADAIVHLATAEPVTGPPALPPAGDRLVIEAALRPDAAAHRLAGRRVLAFAGIGRPGRLAATCRALGCSVEAIRAYPDHWRYSEHDLARLAAIADRRGLLLVTSEKDRMRLPPAWRPRVQALGVEIGWDGQAVLAMLDHHGQLAAQAAGTLARLAG